MADILSRGDELNLPAGSRDMSRDLLGVSFAKAGNRDIHHQLDNKILTCF